MFYPLKDIWNNVWTLSPLQSKCLLRPWRIFSSLKANILKILQTLQSVRVEFIFMEEGENAWNVENLIHWIQFTAEIIKLRRISNISQIKFYLQHQILCLRSRVLCINLPKMIFNWRTLEQLTLMHAMLCNVLIFSTQETWVARQTDIADNHSPLHVEMSEKFTRHSIGDCRI